MGQKSVKSSVFSLLSRHYIKYPDLPSYEIPGTDKTALSVFLSMAYNKSRFFQTTQTTSLPHTPAARLCMHNLSNKKTVFPDTVPP